MTEEGVENKSNNYDGVFAVVEIGKMEATDLEKFITKVEKEKKAEKAPAKKEEV